jgi:hypothetical protein
MLKYGIIVGVELDAEGHKIPEFEYPKPYILPMVDSKSAHVSLQTIDMISKGRIIL